MNKFLCPLIAFTALASPIIAYEGPMHGAARVAAFFPTQKKFRDIYDNCIATYEFEASQRFGNNYEVWGNAGWVGKTGHTEFFHTKTTFKNANISFGGKYLASLGGCMNVYMGLGMNIAIVHVHNDSRYVKREVLRGGVGAVAKLGLSYQTADSLLLELFTDYLYQRIHFKESIQIGGWKFGGGLGYVF